MVAWDVYYRGRWIDTVFFDASQTAQEVKRSLVQHDGFPPSITVRKEKR